MPKPEIVVIAGPNGSGKSTYTEFIVGPNQFADETFEYINADEIKKAISLIPELVKVCDSLNIWDNSTETPYRIFRKKKDTIDIFKNPIWDEKDIKKLTDIK